MAIEKYFTDQDQWALILGGSSGFGLAAARRLAAEGMHLLILHRDRKKEMSRIESAFTEIRNQAVQVRSFNADALRPEVRKDTIAALKEVIGDRGRVKLLLHTIAKGNLKPMAPPPRIDQSTPQEQSEAEKPEALYQRLYERRLADLPSSTPTLQNQDFHLTLDAMAFSLYDWVQALHQAGCFATDARVIGLTSEGASRAWPFYAAVSAAKAALEAICRSIALEFAPHGIRCNLVQPGVTDTPSLRLIPGSEHLKQGAVLRNPFRRLTRPEDVANAIYLLCREEAAWINGAVIPVDGGEGNG